MKRVSFLLLVLIGAISTSVAQTGDPLRQEGMASWYGKEFAGRPTASGEIFNPDMYTAAHPNLPFGTVLTITNRQNMRQVTVRINDRGPFVAARIIDLSQAAAEALDMVHSGVVPVLVERAVNTALGPVGVPTVTISPVVPPPVITTPAVVPVAPPALSPPVVSQVPPAAPPPVVSPPPVAAVPPQVAPPAAELPSAVSFVPAEPYVPPAPPSPSSPPPPPVVAQQPVMFSVPAANILGGIPSAASNKSYRLQVGAYSNPRNALDAHAKLKNAGLNPEYERHGDLYRVVLNRLKASEIQSIAQTLGNNGFREALIREETGN